MKKHFSRIVMIVSVAAVFGFAGTALAYRGWGCGDDAGRGKHHGSWSKQGAPCLAGDVTDEQLKQLNTEREAFFTATKDLRQEIYAKELALKSELANKSPDVKIASTLQKELSDLEAAFSQKQIEHRVKMKAINPDAGIGDRCGEGKRGCGRSQNGGCPRK